MVLKQTFPVYPAFAIAVFKSSSPSLFSWMLGAKPPSSPTLVASCPYFFFITAWKSTQVKTNYKGRKTSRQGSRKTVAKRKRSLPSGDDILLHPSSWLPWKKMPQLGESWIPEQVPTDKDFNKEKGHPTILLKILVSLPALLVYCLHGNLHW